MELPRRVVGVQRSDEADELLLDKQVCFALYAASRAVTDAYRTPLARLGLTYPQYLVMLVLWERGESTVRELGQALDLDYGTLSPLLKRLEQRGMVQKSRSEADDRVVTVALSPHGQQLRAHALPIPGEISRVLGLDAAEDRQRLITALRALTASARQHTATPERHV